jgi:periplasmic divalent cation tolerance protein
MSEAMVVLTTFRGHERAVEVANALVEEELAACVNVLGEMHSVYRWEGEVESQAEFLCVIKTTAATFERLRARIVELHPYEVPEVLALPVAAAHAPYLQWLIGSVK